jgi:hypothetical protein
MNAGNLAFTTRPDTPENTCPRSRLQEPALLLDSHVHFQNEFSWEPFLRASAKNFTTARHNLNLGGNSPGCLVMTEIAGINAFRLLSEGIVDLSPFGWMIEHTEEPCTLLLYRRDGERIFLVAGRQINSLERLEVLALGTTREFTENRPIGELIIEIAELGATAVLPWGVGKWLGRRGHIIRSLINAGDRLRFYLGDNGGRPAFSPKPRLLRMGEARGIAVLPGSDPLPLASQEARAASCGVVMTNWNEPGRPMEWIRDQLAKSNRSPQMFGSFSSMSFALRSQVALRLPKKKKNQPAKSLQHRDLPLT